MLKVRELLVLVKDLEETLDRSPAADMEGASGEAIEDLVRETGGLIGSLAFMVSNMINEVKIRIPRKPPAPAFALIAHGQARDVTPQFSGAS